MAQFRRTAAGLGYKGIPALVFIALNNYGVGTQSHEEKLLILNKLYAFLRGYLPVAFDADEFNTKFSGNLKEANEMLMDAIDEYEPSFEGLKQNNPDEKEFVKHMLSIYILLVEIVTTSKIIDDQKPESEEVNF